MASRKKSSKRRWTQAERAKLVEHLDNPQMPVAELAKALRRTPQAVYVQLSVMRKNRATLNELDAVEPEPTVAGIGQTDLPVVQSTYQYQEALQDQLQDLVRAKKTELKTRRALRLKVAGLVPVWAIVFAVWLMYGRG